QRAASHASSTWTIKPALVMASYSTHMASARAKR
ncbi:MAG: hypothetical protein ACI934_001766, partial [Pseudohongiellaceae bacterium]